MLSNRLSEICFHLTETNYFQKRFSQVVLFYLCAKENCIFFMIFNKKVVLRHNMLAISLYVYNSLNNGPVAQKETEDKSFSCGSK